jgi:hypothetical protein
MGIDTHTLNFLTYCARRKPFGRTATIGRQAIHVEELGYGTYCEDLFRSRFGAHVVESFDNSSYESATHVVDMNTPLPNCATYDTVFDGGCLEHVFDVAQGLENVSTLCAEGGRIIHVLPANNYCGHGFWQFSPELFFSLYDASHGYRDTEVFLVDLSDDRHWYRVRRPEAGRRVNVNSRHPAVIMVVTERAAGPFSHVGVQQSDYVYLWSNDGPPPNKSAIRAFVGRYPALLSAAKSLRRRLQPDWRFRREFSISAANPDLIPVPMSSVIT